MTTRRILAELRRKKRCIERAIEALERLQEVEQDLDASELQKILNQVEMSNVVEFPDRVRRCRSRSCAESN